MKVKNLLRPGCGFRVRYGKGSAGTGRDCRARGGTFRGGFDFERLFKYGCFVFTRPRVEHGERNAERHIALAERQQGE